MKSIIATIFLLWFLVVIFGLFGGVIFFGKNGLVSAVFTLAASIPVGLAVYALIQRMD